MKEDTYWHVTSELPQEVFEVWRKPAITRNPVAIVATVDPDGTPRTTPVDSLRAITPKLLRLISSRQHNTFTNLSHDGRVMVALVAPQYNCERSRTH
jgi:flavin reductase (DIM6/NTAB) family NADH-FMN oxidoreductase RutF